METHEGEPNQLTATESYLKSINPSLWQSISSQTLERRDERWFDLTQSHLKDYEAGLVDTDQFRQEELEFLFLNFWGSKDTQALDTGLPQRGFSFTSKGLERFHKLEDFIGDVSNESRSHLAKNNMPLWVLVGGIGISGKATLRTVLAKELAEKFPDKVVISWDRDYQKIFPPPWQGDIYVVEDVHGLDEGMSRFDGVDGLSGGYDLVVYSQSPPTTYKESLLNRGLSWLRSGKMDLTAPDMEYPQDTEERVRQTADELERTRKVGSEWFKEQIRVLKEIKKRKIPIVVADPTEIFKELYGFKVKSELSNIPFLEALSKGLEETTR